MSQRQRCSLCLRACDERLVGDDVNAFCSTCLAAMGRFATSGSARTRFWPALEGITTREPPTLDTPVFDETVQELIDREPGLFGNLRTVLEIQPTLPPADAETQVDLAVAYLEMGLRGEALREAASALQDRRHLSRPSARKALMMLLDRRHLQFRVEELLIVVREGLRSSPERDGES